MIIRVYKYIWDYLKGLSIGIKILSFENILGADKIFECQNCTSKELRFELLNKVGAF